MKRGFALVAAIALIAILAISAAVAVPAVLGILDAQRVANAYADMKAVARGDSTFQSFLGKLPGRLSHMAEPIAGTDSTTCNGIAPSGSVVTYGGTTAGKWGNNGPYFYRAVPVSGLPTDIGVIDDIQYRETANNTAGAIDLVIADASVGDAEALNELVDGAGEALSDQSGIVQWGPPNSSQRVRLIYRIQIPKTC